MAGSNIQNQINNHKEIYKVTKGFCLIINIINFDGNEELRRDGSEENVKLVKEAFEYHGFQVKDYCDLNHDQIINLIDEKVNHEKCKSFDAFVLYIHTHGIADHILCKNSYEKNENDEIIITKIINFHQIIELFKDENCKNLINKPKLIFFDCCRNANIKFDDTSSFDEGLKRYQKTEYSDLIVCFSTLKGNYSSRNRLSKCLYENLMNQTEYKPFHDILFDINVSMKQIINPFIEHQQAIEYTIINMDKKLCFMEKDFEKMEKMKKEIFSEKVKKENLGSIWFDVKEPVESFTGRIKELDELHKLVQRKRELTVISQITSISGLSGIGKSELARKYVHEHSQDYDSNVIWINAESYVTLVESFHRLAQDELGISTKNIDGKGKDIKSIVKDVYKYFAKKKSLFIFDNAEKYKTQRNEDEGVDKFLSSSSLPPNANKPYFIITSRNQKWGNIQVLQLNTFTEEEAIEFIKKTLDIRDDLQNDEIRELADKLQRFPLALQQAVAYIRETDKELKNIRKEFKISNYLKKYEEKTKELLDFEFQEDSNDSYTKTTFVTWNITLDVIKQKEHGNQALKILNTMAYFAPDNIPVKTFLPFIEGDSEELGFMIQLLKQYSIVSSEEEQAILNVHRLVQQVTRLKLKDQGNEEEILRKVLGLVNKVIGKENLDHAVSAWNYASKYDEIMKEFSMLPSHIIRELDNSVRYEEAYLFGVKASKLLVRVLGPDHLYTLLTMNNIAGVFDNQGKYEEALKLYQEVLNKRKQILGDDHPDTLTTMNNIALICHSDVN